MAQEGLCCSLASSDLGVISYRLTAHCSLFKGFLLIFLIYKMGLVIVSTSQSLCEDQSLFVKHLEQCLPVNNVIC